jgi:hypothetical protein
MAELGYNSKSTQSVSDTCDNNHINTSDERTELSAYFEQFVEISSVQVDLPVRLLAKLSLVSMFAYCCVEKKLKKYKKLYEKIKPIFAKKLHKKLIGHPITYTGKSVKIVAIADMLYGHLGIMPAHEISSDRRLALTNICLLARSPANITIVVMVSNFPFVIKQITENDYTKCHDDTIPTSDELLDNPTRPGGYFVDLDLPFKNNPILIGPSILAPRLITVCICDSNLTTVADDDSFTNVVFDPMFAHLHFSHAFLHFDTVGEDAYDWEKYGIGIGGEVNKRVIMSSLLLRRDDERLISD